MASEPVIEIVPFLQPIAGDNPAGLDLREQSDPDFATVKAARRKIVSLAKAARFDNSVETELNDQWKIIRKLAPSVLKKKSKDLEVAAWFAESLLKLHGFVGLRDGFEVISQLVENFWDNLYPAPDEDGLETRIYPLISLNGEEGNGTLVLPIKNTPILPESEVILSLTSLTRIREAMKLDDAAEKEAKLTDLGVNQQTLQNQLGAVSPEEAAGFIEDLDQLLSTWAKIGELIDEKCQQAESTLSLPLSGVRGAVEEVRELYQQMMRNQLEAAEPEEANSSPTESMASDSSDQVAAQSGKVAGPAQSREEAIKQLHDIARYFKKAEPHSPMAGIIERAAQWAKLPLPQLLAELIPDANARMHYSLMTGIEIGADFSTENRNTSAPATKEASVPENTDNSKSESDWSF